MDMIFVLFAYLVNAVIAIEFSLTIFGNKTNFKKVLLVSILSGLFDYLIKEFAIPSLHLVDGLHILTGLVFIIILCKFYLRLTTIGSLCISILSYILAGIGEFVIIIILVTFVGLDFINSIKDSKFLVTLCGISGMLTLLVPLFYLKWKNIQLIKLDIMDNN